MNEPIPNGSLRGFPLHRGRRVFGRAEQFRTSPGRPLDPVFCGYATLHICRSTASRLSSVRSMTTPIHPLTTALN